MIKPIQKYLNFLNRLLDFLLVVVAYYCAVYFWLIIVRDTPDNMAMAVSVAWRVAVSSASLIVLFFQTAGLYDAQRLQRIRKEILTVVGINTIIVLMLASLLYTLRYQDYSRGVLSSFYLFTNFLLLSKRLGMRYVLRYIRRLGMNQKHVVLVGAGELALQYHESVQAHPEYGFCIDGYVAEMPSIESLRYLGEYDVLSRLLDGPKVDEVVVALESDHQRILPEILSATEKQGTKLVIIPFYNNYMSSCVNIDTIGAINLISIRETPLDDVLNTFLKRFCDVLFSFLLIILTSPIMLAAAIGIKLTSPGPILFRQERVGKNKKTFYMYKFRSMHVNDAQDTAWSATEDARRTKFGSFIRKTSIDETPQFFNVLKGDMSLIGPRPEIPFFVNKFKDEIPLYMVKHRVRPGITGWAQVNGYRGDTSIKERIHFDIWYIEHWSIWLDLRILFRTVFGGMVNGEKL